MNVSKQELDPFHIFVQFAAYQDPVKPHSVYKIDKLQK